MSDLAFHDLLALWLDNELDEAGCAQLLQILRAQPELREQAIKELMLVRTLRSMPVFSDADLGAEVIERIRLQDQPDPELTAGVLARLQKSPPVPTAVANSPAPVTPRPTQKPRPVAQPKPVAPPQRPEFTVFTALAAVAAVVVIAGLTAILVHFALEEPPLAETPTPQVQPDPAQTPQSLPTPEPDPTPAPVIVAQPKKPAPKPVSVPGPALLGFAQHKEAQEASPWTQSTEFFAGKGEIQSGTLEVDLKNSVRLRIVGPAKWETDSLESLTLELGKLSAEVTPNAKGYTVNAHRLEVTDLGTRFAVSANAEDAAVLVYDGLVEAGVADQKERTKLTTKQTAQVTQEKQQLEPLAAHLDPAKIFAPRYAWSGKIRSLAGVTQLDYSPPSLQKDSFPRNQAIIFKERQKVLPESGWVVNLRQPGDEVVGGDHKRVPLDPPPGRVSDYLLHFTGAKMRGYVQFDSPVIGVITEGKLLTRADEWVGKMGTEFPEFDWRGTDKGDTVRIEADARTVTFELGAREADQIRIFVLEES